MQGKPLLLLLYQYVCSVQHQEGVAGDGGTKVGEILYHLNGVVTNGDAWDAIDVLAHDFGYLKTESKTKFSTCICEAADESL